MSELNEAYWTKRYEDGSTGWDIGYASPQLIKAAEKAGSDKKILIPGAGNAYEAEELWNKGFENLYICDLSEAPLNAFLERVPDFPKTQLLHGDFFELDQQFDVVLEQTFFCALPPSMREQYVSKMSEILVDKGVLTGLLFDFPLTEQGPPFGGSQEEYRERFSTHFEITHLAISEHSITPRSGKEFYFELVKK